MDIATLGRLARFATMANFVGLPAISVPAGEPLFHTPEAPFGHLSLGVLVERLLCAAAFKDCYVLLRSR